MTRIGLAIAALALALGSPALAQTAPLGPAEAIAKAVSVGEIEGIFEFTVRSSGASGFNAYLNSDLDYRSPANLSVELHTVAQNALLARLGGRAEDILKGKKIRVKGIARRVPIKNREGVISYYQTRIDVDTGDQIEIVG